MRHGPRHAGADVGGHPAGDVRTMGGPDPSPTGALEGRVQPDGRARERARGAVLDRTATPWSGGSSTAATASAPRIARGGMASVYEATDLRLDRPCAVKVMHAGLGDDEEFAARFVREARSAARLDHPNVVAVFDQGDDDGTVFLVMEYVAGHTLRDVIRKESPMSPVAGAGAGRAGALGAGARPPRRADPPRRQARERPHRRRRPGQGRRLRPGQGGQRRHPAHRDRRRADRHRLLPRARAGRRRPLRRPRRRLRRGRAALRAAHRHQAARGRVADPGRLQARARGRAAAVAGACPGCRRTSTRWSPAPPPATSTSGRPTPACCSTRCTGSRRPCATASARTPS